MLVLYSNGVAGTGSIYLLLNGPLNRKDEMLIFLAVLDNTFWVEGLC